MNILTFENGKPIILEGYCRLELHNLDLMLISTVYSVLSNKKILFVGHRLPFKCLDDLVDKIGMNSIEATPEYTPENTIIFVNFLFKDTLDYARSLTERGYTVVVIAEQYIPYAKLYRSAQTINTLEEYEKFFEYIEFYKDPNILYYLSCKHNLTQPEKQILEYYRYFNKKDSD